MFKHTMERAGRGLASSAYWLVLFSLGGCMPPGLDEGSDSTTTGTGALPMAEGATPASLGPSASLAESWALYTLNIGSHSAIVSGAQPKNPIAGFTTVAGRDYRFRLNPSASYVITRPTQPSDQFDWNKLPGISDCGTLDLSVNGAMFGWRWRLDTTPKVLEITAYANNNSTHLTPAAPLLVLDAADLGSDTPLRYRVWLDGSRYQFAVSGTVRGRPISATAVLPRVCPGSSATGLKWASGFYFGGTSTAPSKITGNVAEIAFTP